MSRASGSADGGDGWVAMQLAKLFPSDARLVNSSHEVDALKREVEDALAPQRGAPGAHLLPLASLRACVSYVPTQALTLGRRDAAVWALKKMLASKRKSAEEEEVEERTHGLVRLLPGHREGASAPTRGNLSEVDRVKEAIRLLESPSSSALESAPCSSVVGAPCSSRVPPPSSWRGPPPSSRVAPPQQLSHKNEGETPQESLGLKSFRLAVVNAQVGAYKSLAANDHESLAANAHKDKTLPTTSTRHESVSLPSPSPSPSVTWRDEDSEDNEEMISVDQGDGNDRGDADAPENLKGKRATGSNKSGSKQTGSNKTGSNKSVTNSRPKKTVTNTGPGGLQRDFEGAMPFRVGRGVNRENVDKDMESREELATATAHAGTEPLALLDDHQEKSATQVGTENSADPRVTSVMYDGEEVPQVQVSTSKHLFQNGAWGIVVGLLLAVGLLALFPNIRSCMCTWRTR